MTSPAVHIRDLRKTYVVSQQEAGAKTALQGLVHRRKVEVRAVDGISFYLAGRPLGAIALAVALFAASRAFWRAGLRHYSGASA